MIPNNKKQSQEIKNLKTEILNEVYPVGSIYINVNNVNPSTLFGGEWVEWGAGRVPVGVDTSQYEFNSPEILGGNKRETLTVGQIPSHNHRLSSNSSHRVMTFDATDVKSVRGTSQLAYPNAGSNFKFFGTNSYRSPTKTIGANMVSNTEHTGSGESHNNLQPYITCYMWKRTA